MRNHASSGSWLIQVQNFSRGGIYPNYLTREAELCRLVQSGSRPNLISHNNLAKEGHKSTQLRHCAANIAVKNKLQACPQFKQMSIPKATTVSRRARSASSVSCWATMQTVAHQSSPAANVGSDITRWSTGQPETVRTVKRRQLGYMAIYQKWHLNSQGINNFAFQS